MSQRQDRRARRKADAPATRQSSRRQRPGGKRNGSKTGPANPAPKQTPRQQSKAADGKDPAENEYSPAAEIVAAGNKTGRSTKAGQPTEKAVRWRKGRPAGSSADRLTENRPPDRKQTGRRRSGSDEKQGDAARRLHLPLLRDSGAVRTLDPQLRRLLLYPTELRNHRRAGPESPVCGCKGRKNFSFSSPFRRFMDENLPFFTELFCRADCFVYICRLESPKRVSVLLTFLQNFIANGC